MFHISAFSVDEALYRGVSLIKREGNLEHTRNGDAYVINSPVITEYVTPVRHISYCPVRDANPFFHLMEALWMLCGWRDVRFVSYYAKQIAQYSDDGEVFHGAYGYRWRNWFGFDQLETIIEGLRTNPSSRRYVLTMWSPDGDLVVMDDGSTGGPDSKDIPCNLMAKFRVNCQGKLDMTVFNRSNDMVWGAYGANAVHFSMLLMYVSERTGIPMGRYYQVSTDFHAYVSTYAKVQDMPRPERTVFASYQLGANTPDWLPITKRVLRGDWTQTSIHFFDHCVIPMMKAFDTHRKGENTPMAIELLSHYTHPWCDAGRRWLQRRLK